MIELTASRGVVAVLANSGVIGLSTYSTNLLTLLVIAAGTDYAIFILAVSRSAQCRGAHSGSLLYDVPGHRAHYPGFGPDRRRRGILSKLHPAPVLQRLGIPAAIGVLVALAAALTLARAVLTSAPTSACSTPDARRAPGVGGSSARPSSAGPGPSWWSRSRWRWWVCSPCRAIRPATTPAPSCMFGPRPTSAMLPQNDIPAGQAQSRAGDDRGG